MKFAVCQCATQSKIREISIFLQYYRVKVPGYLDTAVHVYTYMTYVRPGRKYLKIDENENS